MHWIAVVVRFDGWASEPHHRVTTTAAYYDGDLAQREVERLNSLPARPEGTEYFLAWAKLYGQPLATDADESGHVKNDAAAE